MPPDEPGRGLLFGSVADEYERYRMGYPEELVDAVFGYAAQPVRSALEVGAGTGKATGVFAGRGVRITALEPDPAMAAVLRRSTSGLPVDVVVSTFEHFDSAAHFDLLYAAAAWHWTDPRSRWQRAFDRLVPGGVIALFGRPFDLADPDLAATVEDLERPVLPPRSEESGQPWSLADLVRFEGFTDAVEQKLPSAVVVTAEAFVRRLGTASAYLALDPRARRSLMDHLRAALPEQVEVDATTRLVMGRRR